MHVPAIDLVITLTPQVHADLRLAWKMLEDAGHQAAADRMFELINSPQGGEFKFQTILPYRAAYE